MISILIMKLINNFFNSRSQKTNEVSFGKLLASPQDAPACAGPVCYILGSMNARCAMQDLHMQERPVGS